MQIIPRQVLTIRNLPPAAAATLARALSLPVNQSGKIKTQKEAGEFISVSI
jgi:hypothetical protein